MELEKDRLQTVNSDLLSENGKLKDEVENLRANVEKTNQFILDSFKQTLAYSREEKITSLENDLKEKDKEILELKNDLEKVREALRSETLEHKLARMDHQNALIQNKNARHTSLDGEREYDMEEKKGKNDKSDRSHTTTTKSNNRKIFKIQTSIPETSTESTTKRRTRGAYKKNTAIQTLKKELKDTDEESNSLFFDDDDEEFEINIEIDDENFYEEDKEGEDEENFVPKKGKRKAREIKKKPQTKKVRKNENKELLIMNRNTMQYHLFN